MYSMSDERKALVTLTVINDYLKVNGFRIASHSLQRTETPLSSRTDIKPLLPMIKEGDTLDILGLNSESKITFCKSYYNDVQLVAHFYDDAFFIDAIKSILATDLTGVHFCFFTNGILMPELLQKKDWEKLLGVSMEELEKRIPIIEFYESRVNIEMVSKLSDQKVYLKNIISKIKRMHNEFSESDVEFEGEKCLAGHYDILYHGKMQTYPYWIAESGVQLEAPDNGEKIGEFVGGFR